LGLSIELTLDSFRSLKRTWILLNFFPLKLPEFDQITDYRLLIPDF
jgi:hypothetical protein